MLFLQGSAGTRNKCGELRIYSGVTFQKMIKIGRHLTKLFQFITTQVTLCSFLGHPVYKVAQKSKPLPNDKKSY